MKISISPVQRIVIFLVIIIVIPLLLCNFGKTTSFYEIESAEFKSSKDQKWEYIKDRITAKDGQIFYVRKGPILIKAIRATKEDSIALERNMEELREILPHKTIDYFSNHMGIDIYEDITARHPENPVIIEPIEFYNSVITLSFHKATLRNIVNTSVLDNGSIITREDPNYRARFFGKRSLPENICFDFPDSISIDDRYKYIRYDLYRWLCLINPENQYAVSYSDGEGILNTPEFIPDFNTRTEKDIFFIQKLYSEDFMAEFESYLYANYPWRYAQKFMNKAQSKLMAYLCITLILILFFLVVFPVYNKTSFQMRYANYFISFLIIDICILYATNIYNYFVNLEIPLDLVGSFLLPLGVVSLIAFMTSWLLWGIEKIFIGNDDHVLKNYILHFLFTSITLNLPLVFIMYLNMLYGNLEYIIPFILLFIALSFLRVFLMYLHRNSEMLIRAKDVQLSQLRELQAATELNSLHAQINPHFLYNALNSIASLAHVDSDKTEKMALSLSDLFRYSVNRKGEKLSTIQEEVTMVNNYLQIEKIRFGEDLEFSLNVEDSIQETKIPRFILQPLIENSIKHGVSKIEEKGNITLDIYQKNKKLIIAVSDNGPDFPEGLISGHGLQSVFDLLRLSYGEQASMNWENLPKKKITITITSSF